MKITVELSDETVRNLNALAHTPAVPRGDVADVLRYLAASAADGVRRPGSWERGWVLQAFGDYAEPPAHPSAE